MPTFILGSALEPWIEQGGQVLRAYREQDSGCVCLIAEMDGRRAFFKQARTKAAAVSLTRVVHLYEEVRHPALVPLWGYWEAADGPTLVFECVEGENLSHNERFLGLPPTERKAALDVVFDLHLLLANRGFVSCDFYDGSLLYDFEARRMFVIDLDEYRPGPFRSWRKRLPGSQRFMAPEESRRGARLDQRTTVFHMGRAAQVLLGDQGPAVERATRATPSERFPRVGQFVLAWRKEGHSP